MSKFGIQATINPEITIRLTEGEARALDALAGYGFDSFIEIFYKLGKHYMQPYEKDLRSLFEKIRGDSGIMLFISRADDARGVFTGSKRALSQEAYERWEAIVAESRASKPAAPPDSKPSPIEERSR